MYSSREMKESSSTFSVRLNEAPPETICAIGTVETYHAPLTMAYEKIQDDLDRQKSDCECSRMADIAINCTVRPKGLRPSLLEFGVFPRAAKRSPAAAQLKRDCLMDKIVKKVKKGHSWRKLAYGLTLENGQKGKERLEILPKLPGSLLLNIQ